MKTTKGGNVKLEKGEVRVGNFFVRDEGDTEYVKVTDLNSCFTMRIAKRMPLGIWLENMLDMARTDGRALDTLKTWCSAMWAVLSVAPDQEYVVSIVDAADANLKRHPDWYGYNPTDDDAANDDAAQEVKEMKQFEEEVKNIEEKTDEKGDENKAD